MTLLSQGDLHAGRVLKARMHSKLPVEIAALLAGRHHTSVLKPEATFLYGLRSTNVGAGCSCHSTGIHNDRATLVP